MADVPSVSKNMDYSQAGAYFVTVCVQDKRCFLGNVVDNGVALSSVGECVYQSLNQIPERFESVGLDEFVIMPNHVHAIIIINDDNVEVIHELPLRKQRRKCYCQRLSAGSK